MRGEPTLELGRERARKRERLEPERTHSGSAEPNCRVSLHSNSAGSLRRLAPGPPAALHITSKQYHMSPGRGAQKALTGCKRKKQRVGFDRGARNGVSARRVGRPAEGRGRCTTPRTPGGLLVPWRRGGCLLRRSRASPSLASHVRLDPLDPLDPPPAHLSPLRSRSNGIRTPNLAFAHPKT